MTEPKKFINLNLKVCNLSSESKCWYNLETNRTVKNIKGKLSLKYPPVAATKWEYIVEFANINHMYPYDLTFNKNSDLNAYNKIYLGNKSGSSAFLNNPDVEDVSDDILENLDEFSFSRIVSKAKVVDVIDGDTITIATILKSNHFSQSYWNRKKTKKGNEMKKLNLSVVSKTDGFNVLIKLRLRLFGIDTAEKENIVGQRAKEWAILKYKSLKNIVYVHLLGTDARGRTLANIYEDDECTSSINDQILAYNDPYYGKVAVSYFGATKDEKFTKETSSAKIIPNMEPVLISSSSSDFKRKISATSSVTTSSATTPTISSATSSATSVTSSSVTTSSVTTSSATTSSATAPTSLSILPKSSIKLSVIPTIPIILDPIKINSNSLLDEKGKKGREEGEDESEVKKLKDQFSKSQIELESFNTQFLEQLEENTDLDFFERKLSEAKKKIRGKPKKKISVKMELGKSPDIEKIKKKEKEKIREMKGLKPKDKKKEEEEEDSDKKEKKTGCIIS